MLSSRILWSVHAVAWGHCCPAGSIMMIGECGDRGQAGSRPVQGRGARRAPTCKAARYYLFLSPTRLMLQRNKIEMLQGSVRDRYSVTVCGDECPHDLLRCLSDPSHASILPDVLHRSLIVPRHSEMPPGAFFEPRPFHHERVQGSMGLGLKFHWKHSLLCSEREVSIVWDTVA